MLRAYRLTTDGAGAEWDAAKIDSADALADQVQGIIDNPVADAAIARVRIDALRWLASKKNPRVYAERIDSHHTVKAIDLTPIILAANARLLAANARRASIDVTPSPLALDALL